MSDAALPADHIRGRIEPAVTAPGLHILTAAAMVIVALYFAREVFIPLAIATLLRRRRREEG
jgi:hypothetical protein